MHDPKIRMASYGALAFGIYRKQISLCDPLPFKLVSIQCPWSISIGFEGDVREYEVQKEPDHRHRHGVACKQSEMPVLQTVQIELIHRKTL
mmetsp:Transcript_43802/g.102234  ORF Transcript_43802/g.102234 Transcript_43802/m.102234 type:complete len:91 (+) Transcript_43802:63-335(+)